MAAGVMGISIIGDTAGVQAMLLHLQNKLSSPNLAGFLHLQVDPYLRARTSARFANEGDDVVGKWIPLEAATESIRASKGFPSAHPINDRTGELRDYAVNSPSDVTPTGLGASLTYPGVPASGELADKVMTAQVGRNYPPTVARPIFGVDANDLAAVLTMLAYEIKAP
jgi:hypothetical protein